MENIYFRLMLIGILFLNSCTSQISRKNIETGQNYAPSITYDEDFLKYDKTR